VRRPCAHESANAEAAKKLLRQASQVFMLDW